MSVIQHPERMRQLVDFGGLVYGKIMPTDIDGMIEYRNKAYVIIELKYGNTDTPDGQRMCLERMVEDTTFGGKRAVAIIAEHYVADTSESIFADKCIVRELYLSDENKWRPPIRTMTVRELIDLFLSQIDAT